jgi:hypothetical protein
MSGRAQIVTMITVSSVVTGTLQSELLVSTTLDMPVLDSSALFSWALGALWSWYS